MSSHLGRIQKLLVVVISTALVLSPAAYAQGVGDRDAKAPEKVREQAEAAQALRGQKYMSFDKISYGVATPEAQRYARRVFNEFESDGLLTKEMTYNEALELQFGRRILEFHPENRLETRPASLPLWRTEHPTLLAAREAFEPSWAYLFGANIVDFVPRDETDYSSLFPGAALSRSAIDQMAKIADAGGSPRMSTLYDLDVALGSYNDLVIIIAHNDDGNILGPGGSKRSLDELSQRCAAVLKLCIFLPCNAKTFITDPSLPTAKQDIDPLDAIKLAKAIAQDASEARASLQPVTGQNPSLRPHPAMVIEKYTGFVESVFSRIEKMDANQKTWWKVMLVPTKASVVLVVVGLLVNREAAN